MLPAATIRTAIEERLFTAGPSAEPISWSAASGGLSEASVWRVQRGETAYAVRRWWTGIDPRYVAWIGTTLRGVVTSGLNFVAAPVEEGDAWPMVDASSGRWEAAPWKPGADLAETPGRGFAIAASIEGLAEFHRRMRNRGDYPSAARSAFAERANQLRSMPAPRPPSHHAVAEAFPELPRIAGLLPAAADRARTLLSPWIEAATPLQPIHGDARPDHFLVTGRELTGLIDFGAMRVDTPLADVARLAGELAAGDAACRDALVEAYAVAARKAIDRRAVAALDLSGAVLSGANWLRWLSQPGADRDPQLLRQRLRSILSRIAA